jgi:hypothetical protein
MLLHFSSDFGPQREREREREREGGREGGREGVLFLDLFAQYE